MVRMRRDVWKLGNDWDDAILWYARAVKDLSARPFADMTSWRYLAAMHGVSETLWRHHGYLRAGEALPNATAFQQQDRDQCQHHTWYFLPWHRGYLRAFEKIVAASIVKQGGPSDWALPYWNYNDLRNSHRLELPRAFGSTTWPDPGPNPLFVKARYGLSGQSGRPIAIDNDSVELETALTEPDYVGASGGGSPGFGGGRTPFKHGARDRSDEGLLEQSPHDNVHGDIGGVLNNDFNNPLGGGLMSSPATAGLDPIFWLHHANIDRLWEVWLKRPSGHQNPTSEEAWMGGPPGSRPFIMPEPDNSTRTAFSPDEMLDTTSPKLDYTYEDTSDPFPGADRLVARLNNLGIARPMSTAAMADKPQVELIGASAAPLHLSGPQTEARVRLDDRAGPKMLRSFQPNSLAAGASPEPDRVFLNLENVKGSSDGASFKVYVGLKPSEDPEQHPENMAGVVTLFGVHEASAQDGSHGGNGLNKVVEITKVVDRLHLDGVRELNEMPVRFVLRRGQASDIQIGRISIYRQGN